MPGSGTPEHAGRLVVALAEDRLDDAVRELEDVAAECGDAGVYGVLWATARTATSLRPAEEFERVWFGIETSRTASRALRIATSFLLAAARGDHDGALEDYNDAGAQPDQGAAFMEELLAHCLPHLRELRRHFLAEHQLIGRRSA